jgi:hypothetical protein
MLIALAMAFGLAAIAGWVWLARAAGQGRNWARIVSTVLVGLAVGGGSPAYALTTNSDDTITLAIYQAMVTRGRCSSWGRAAS